MDANPQQWQLAPTGIRSKQISDVIDDEIYFKLIYFSASTTCLLSFLLWSKESTPKIIWKWLILKCMY